MFQTLLALERSARVRTVTHGGGMQLAEIGAGDRGEYKCGGVKVFAALKTSGSNGRGTKEDGGTASSTVGHKYGFGNTGKDAL